MTNCTFPTSEFSGKKWILLKHMSDSWIVRSSNMEKKARHEKEDNDHHVFEICAQGSVKCTPKKEWDIEKYSFN